MMTTYYLDNAASTPLCEPALKQLCSLFGDHFANPSSGHLLGREAKGMVEIFRERAAKATGWGPAGVIFTSCATEANNMLLRAKKYRRVVVGAIEHSSIYKTALSLRGDGVSVDLAPVTRDGVLDLDALRGLLKEPADLVSVMAVNNETGVGLQPEHVGAVVREMCPTALFHVDAAQAVARALWPRDLSAIDFMTLSSHKFHGPKGVGMLLAPEGWNPRPLLEGGGQEMGYRSGTTPLPLIGAMVSALEFAFESRDEVFLNRCRRFFRTLQDGIPSLSLNGAGDYCAPWIGNIGVGGLRGDAFARALEAEGVMVSMGSACAGQQKKLSRVLEAMKVDGKKGHIRISLNSLQSDDELRDAATLIIDTYTKYALV